MHHDGQNQKVLVFQPTNAQSMEDDSTLVDSGLGHKGTLYDAKRFVRRCRTVGTNLLIGAQLSATMTITFPLFLVVTSDRRQIHNSTTSGYLFLV